MDRITHQPPRQQGYRSTSSLRNDSLKHTRKHKRRKGGIEPKSKAARLWRTVRPRGADYPHGPREPSANVPRTVRQAPADCPPGTRGASETSPNQNSKTQRIESEAEQEREEHATNTARADRPPPPRGLSALHGQTQKQPDFEGQLPLLITGSPKR
jgi:hypothetical protein